METQCTQVNTDNNALIARSPMSIATMAIFKWHISVPK